jgi:hypothetical protein
MNILLYIAAGKGDLINFTGILQLIKDKYNDYNIDFLILKNQYDILMHNPCIRNIIFIEDYADIPKHCTFENHDELILKKFKKDYDHIFNVWACKLQDKSKQTFDYAKDMFSLMNEYGFDIKADRTNMQPIFYYKKEDYFAIENIIENIKNNIDQRKIILIENECFSFENIQEKYNKEIFDYLKYKNYCLAGNGEIFDINISSLGLRQIKLFFQEYCYGFLGISSGMTCAIYAYPTFYTNKKVLISGQHNMWNFSSFIPGKNNYYYFDNFYDIKDIKSLFY